MITVKDQVSMMWGKEVADSLYAEGLLALDDSDSIVHADVEPHTYRVYFKADLTHTFWGPGTHQQYPSHSLKSGFKSVVHRVRQLLDARINLSTRGLHPNAQWHLDRADDILGWHYVDIKSKSTARNQSTMIRNNGFHTRVVPLAMIELPEIHF